MIDFRYTLPVRIKVVCVHTHRVPVSFFGLQKKRTGMSSVKIAKTSGKRLWSCAQPFLLRGLPLQEFSAQFLLGEWLQKINSAAKKINQANAVVRIGVTGTVAVCCSPF